MKTIQDHETFTSVQQILYNEIGDFNQHISLNIQPWYLNM